jgi:hypothetical protein
MLRRPGSGGYGGSPPPSSGGGGGGMGSGGGMGGGGGGGGSCPGGLGGGPSNPCGSCPNGNCWSGNAAKANAQKKELASLPNKDTGTKQPEKQTDKPAEGGRKSASHEQERERQNEERGERHSGAVSHERAENTHPGNTGGMHPGNLGGMHPGGGGGMGGLGGMHPGGLGGLGGGHPGFGSGSRHFSDIRLKRDVVLLGRLADGIALYRYRYIGEDRVYVGVMAQQVRNISPDAVMRGNNGYLLVDYERLGLRLQTWDEWTASGKSFGAQTRSW